MRSGSELQEAVEYMSSIGVELFGINQNPGQHAWTDSPKAYAHLYIDDAAFGCPLVHDPGEERPYVDWYAVHKQLIHDKVLPPAYPSI